MWWFGRLRWSDHSFRDRRSTSAWARLWSCYDFRQQHTSAGKNHNTLSLHHSTAATCISERAYLATSRGMEVDACRTGSPASEDNEGRKTQRLYAAYHLGSVATPYPAGPTITCRPSPTRRVCRPSLPSHAGLSICTQPTYSVQSRHAS